MHITNLGTKEEGIHVELLEYVTPRDGKPFPNDTKSNDLWHWQTSFEANQVNQFADILLKNKYKFISSGLVDFAKNSFGFKKALLVRDVDGHAVRIISR